MRDRLRAALIGPCAESGFQTTNVAFVDPPNKPSEARLMISRDASDRCSRSAVIMGQYCLRYRFFKENERWISSPGRSGDPHIFVIGDTDFLHCRSHEVPSWRFQLLREAYRLSNPELDLFSPGGRVPVGRSVCDRSPGKKIVLVNLLVAQGLDAVCLISCERVRVIGLSVGQAPCPSSLPRESAITISPSTTRFDPTIAFPQTRRLRKTFRFSVL
jgi:hypothetical protein